MDPTGFGLAAPTLKLIMSFRVNLHSHSIIWKINRNYRHHQTDRQGITGIDRAFQFTNKSVSILTSSVVGLVGDAIYTTN
jgi:hypothetical protein